MSTEDHGLTIRECEQIADKNLKDALEVWKRVELANWGEVMTIEEMVAIAMLKSSISHTATKLAEYKRQLTASSTRAHKGSGPTFPWNT